MAKVKKKEDTQPTVEQKKKKLKTFESIRINDVVENIIDFFSSSSSSSSSRDYGEKRVFLFGPFHIVTENIENHRSKLRKIENTVWFRSADRK